MHINKYNILSKSLSVSAYLYPFIIDTLTKIAEKTGANTNPNIYHPPAIVETICAFKPLVDVNNVFKSLFQETEPNKVFWNGMVDTNVSIKVVILLVSSTLKILAVLQIPGT